MADVASDAKKLEGCPSGTCGGPGVCFVGGTLVTTASGLVPIETLEVGDRVLTSDGSGDTLVDDSWQLIELEMPNPEAVHDTIQIRLLRPAEWLQDAGVGSVIQLAYQEISLAGDALVTHVGPAPAIAEGRGRVVLGTITHRNNELLRLHLNGDQGVLEPTAAHHFYSADRGDWVAARDLAAGEHLITRTGTAVVSRVEAVPGAQRVFNLEVESEHEYFVSELRVLTHNTKPECGGGTPTGQSSRAARREVMRKEGIPTSQQPVSQSKNASGRSYEYEVPKPGGGKQQKSVQQQTMDRSHPGQSHWEAGRVKNGPRNREGAHHPAWAPEAE